MALEIRKDVQDEIRGLLTDMVGALYVFAEDGGGSNDEYIREFKNAFSHLFVYYSGHEMFSTVSVVCSKHYLPTQDKMIQLYLDMVRLCDDMYLDAKNEGVRSLLIETVNKMYELACKYMARVKGGE